MRFLNMVSLLAVAWLILAAGVTPAPAADTSAAKPAARAQALADPAPADPAFEAGVEQARQALARRDAAGALAGLHAALAAAWAKLPFTAVEVHLVAAPPTGYGEFIPRVDNVYRPSEPLILYLEPVGFKVEHDKDKGAFRYRLSADFNLVDAWGHVVSGRRRFGRFEGETRQFPDRLPLTFTYSLAGLPPGEYRLETVLRDLLGEKAYTVVTPVRIEGP